MQKRVLTVALLLSLFFTAAAQAVPMEINFQGKLNNANGAPINASVPITFTIFDDVTGGTSVWTEAQTVDVVHGIFNVQLGV